MAKQGDSSAWGLFLGPIREMLLKIQPPQGAFDPHSAWEHRYSVCSLTPERGAKGEHPKPYGRLVLNRKPAAPDHFTLDVNLTINTRPTAGMRTQATLTCAADRLATLRKWELKSEDFQSNKAVAETCISETAMLERGVLVRRGERERRTSVKVPLTSNWTLMEAVQRLPFDDVPMPRFDMLEDLDLHKAQQMLRPVASVTVDMAGGPVKLYGFRQIGQGILPNHYWLDKDHRLIAVTGALRGYLWERA